MVARPSLLEPKRVQSVFKERIERHKEEIEELEELEKIVEEEAPPNVPWENNETTADPQNVYFEQVTFRCPSHLALLFDLKTSKAWNKHIMLLSYFCLPL